MSYMRIDRISEEVRREVDAIIREELGDPRIGGTFSITRAEVTGDLRYAKIYVSVLEDDRRDDLMEALKSANLTTPVTIRCAITVISTVPILIVYPFLQKYFVTGMALGAVKG